MLVGLSITYVIPYPAYWQICRDVNGPVWSGLGPDLNKLKRKDLLKALDLSYGNTIAPHI